MIGKPCLNCGMVAPAVEVHGHFQCTNCKMNVAPCCEGSACEVVELSWHPINTPIPEGYELAQDASFLMHHNHYAALIRKAG